VRFYAYYSEYACPYVGWMSFVQEKALRKIPKHRVKILLRGFAEKLRTIFANREIGMIVYMRIVMIMMLLF